MSTVRRRATVTGFAALTSLLLVIIGFLVWANILYLADREAALEALADPNIRISMVDEGVLIEPVDSDGPSSGTGLVFLPGAKVEPFAYVRVLGEVAATSGMTIVITEPRLNLALADTRGLDAFTSAAPAITDWAVGGHSLGGVRACMLADSPEVIALILFGSFCATDLSDRDLTVLSLEGSNDELSTQQQIDDAAGLLPADTHRVLIQGANHASFGDYGAQPGDGPLEADRDEVRATIANEVAGLALTTGESTR